MVKNLVVTSPPLNWITDNRISHLLLSDFTGSIILKQYTKYIGELNHSVIVITFAMAKNDPIKGRALYSVSVIWKLINISIRCGGTCSESLLMS